MYKKFFGLSEKPFSITPDLQYLYLGKQHEQGLSTLSYAVKERLGFSLLTGEVGAGKTILSRALLSRLDSSIATALLVNPLLTIPELLKAIIKDFNCSSTAESPQELIQALNEFLIFLASEGRSALVIIDEAQNLTHEALEMVRMLTNLETEKQKLLQILLVGQPELLKKLKAHELRQLNQRVTTRVHLRPLSLVEMMRYINHRISIAGGSGKVFFDPKAYRIIFDESKGYPRLINLICDRALMASFLQENYIVGKDAVKSAVNDWKGKQKTPLWETIKSFVLSQ